MSRVLPSRLAVVGGAVAALLAACSPDGVVSNVTSPTPAKDIGISVAGLSQVCIDPASPPALYTFTLTSPLGLLLGDTFEGPSVSINTAEPGPICVPVLRKFDYFDLTVASIFIEVSITPDIPGTWSFTCVDDGADGIRCSSLSGTTNFLRIGASGPHGSTVTFLFTPTVTGTGCTYTQGRWKNKNSAITAQYDFDGGTNNGLTVLQTPPKGNPYYILAHQYIAAALNVAAGASMDNGGAGTADDVLTAFLAATAYFTVASAATPLPSPYTKDQITALAEILDQYNSGLLGPGHCDEVSQ